MDDPGAITIQGPAANQLALSGNNASRVFEITARTVAQIDGLTFTGGKTEGASFPANSGGGILNSGTLTLVDCTVSGNTATVANGGGILNLGSMALTGSSVWGNTAASEGGGVN